MSKTYRLIGNAFLGVSIFFVVLQQAIVAGSTWTIAQIGKKVAGGQAVTWELAVYCTLLLIVYLPAIASLVCLDRAQVKALYAYLQKLSQKIYGKVAYTISKEDGEKLLPWINGEAQQTLEGALNHAYAMVATLLNALLNALAIAITVSHSLLVAYGLSMLICIIGMTASHHYIQQATKDDIAAKTSLRSHLLHLWDNMILGNVLNKLQWGKAFAPRYQAFSQKKVGLTKKSRMISSLIMIFSLLPIGTTLLLLSQRSSPIVLGALLITLPRQIQIIQSFEGTVSGIIVWRQYVTKLAALYDTLHITPSKQPADYIKKSLISINGKPLASVQVDDFLRIKAGRFTIRGKNGSGKSSFLLHLKLLLQDQAHLLPVDFKYMYYKSSQLSLSTGERMLAVLKELSQSQVAVILLDEWDANLDSKNVVAMDTLIDEIAKRKLIVEVRHGAS